MMPPENFFDNCADALKKVSTCGIILDKFNYHDLYRLHRMVEDKLINVKLKHKVVLEERIAELKDSAEKYDINWSEVRK